MWPSKYTVFLIWLNSIGINSFPSPVEDVEFEGPPPPITSRGIPAVAHRIPKPVDGVRIFAGRGQELWKKPSISKEHCSLTCSDNKPQGCAIAEFDETAQLCTGYSASTAIKFLRSVDEFSVVSTISKNSSKIPGVRLSGTDILFDNKPLGDLLGSYWTEQLCDDLCLAHPACGVTVYSPEFNTCRLQRYELGGLIVLDTTVVSTHYIPSTVPGHDTTSVAKCSSLFTYEGERLNYKCGCWKGTCWSYLHKTDGTDSEWCYTQKRGVPPGKRQWATCASIDDCDWIMTCGSNITHVGMMGNENHPT